MVTTTHIWVDHGDGLAGNGNAMAPSLSTMKRFDALFFLVNVVEFFSESLIFAFFFDYTSSTC